MTGMKQGNPVTSFDYQSWINSQKKIHFPRNVTKLSLRVRAILLCNLPLTLNRKQSFRRHIATGLLNNRAVKQQHTAVKGGRAAAKKPLSESNPNWWQLIGHSDARWHLVLTSSLVLSDVLLVDSWHFRLSSIAARAVCGSGGIEGHEDAFILAVTSR